MTEPDTTKIRALADEHIVVSLSNVAVRALCDGYDEAQRLRDEVGAADLATAVYEAEANAARQALADLVGELRGLAGHGRISGELLNAVVDPYDPDLFQCVHCEQYRDVEERRGGRDTDPGYYCDACVAGP